MRSVLFPRKLSGSDGFAGEHDAFGEGCGLAGDKESGSGVHQDKLGLRAVVSIEDGEDVASVLAGVTAGDIGDGADGKGEIGGSEFALG